MCSRMGSIGINSGVSVQSAPSVDGSQRDGFIPQPKNHVPKRLGSGCARGGHCIAIGIEEYIEKGQADGNRCAAQSAA